MRGPLPIVLAALTLAAPADALVAEVWTRTSFQFTNLGRSEASASATGLATLNGSASSSSHLSTLSVTVAGGELLTAIPITDPNAAPIISAVFSVRNRPDVQGGVFGNLSGAIASGTGGIAPGTMPMTGTVVLCIPVAIQNCLAQLPLVLGATSGGVQIGPGVGGLLTIGGTGTIRISLVGAPYTVKTVSAVYRTGNGAIDVFSEHGFAHGPASLTSSTAQTSGVLQVVTALHTTSVGPGDADLSGAISRTLVHVVPEPALLLLFGAGAGGLAALGRQRERRKR